MNFNEYTYFAYILTLIYEYYQYNTYKDQKLFKILRNNELKNERHFQKNEFCKLATKKKN